MENLGKLGQIYWKIFMIKRGFCPQVNINNIPINIKTEVK
jgi:hypothetical protein